MNQNVNFIINSVSDIRIEPKFESERISQLIFGERVKILENLGEYSFIESDDGVRGYIKSTNIGEGEIKKFKLISRYHNRFVNLPFGSYLSEDDIEKFKIPKSMIVEIEKKFDMIKFSKHFIMVPYLWGGTSDFGFDCSGFIQRLFKFSNNIIIPRNSKDQMEYSQTVSGFENAKKGDLIFFKGHVALYLGNYKIIHANGHYSSVTINDLSDNSDYSKMLLKIMLKIGRIQK